MIGQCREYLIQKLKDAGIKSKVHTSMKTLEKSNESHVGAVLFEGDSYTRSGSKTIYVDQEGVKRKRVKVFNRKTSFMVVIGEYEESKCESIFESFVALLDRGIMVDGNFTGIEVEDADWVDENDSILKAKIAVQVKITFDGGIYKDSALGTMSELEQTLEKE
ncbi:hypothetical protein SAMN02745133_02700 [Desulforamulus putei DSM 12395]|jgi:hypothetical protein|uniref:SON protein n=1 Tax=Desulforamulus putei DSM 12395 TaxID=1121429 RepID=A0A1M5BTW5_9FIRM|nr:SON protein [Desulforamulus putei]SHF45860.1 hypothetical protein SAMN02745133_02700 [Desulforamulus putei DSM 12395]